MWATEDVLRALEAAARGGVCAARATRRETFADPTLHLPQTKVPTHKSALSRKPRSLTSDGMAWYCANAASCCCCSSEAAAAAATPARGCSSSSNNTAAAAAQASQSDLRGTDLSFILAGLSIPIEAF